MPQHAWMVRAGDNNQLADQVEEKKAIAIGWAEMKDMSGLQTRQDFKDRYIQSFPDHSPSRVNVNAGQIYRFAQLVSIGDYVLTYAKASRQLFVGVVKGEMQYDPAIFGKEHPNIRRVDWRKKVSRDDFGPAFRASTGSSLTVFNLDDYLDEINKVISDGSAAVDEPERPENEVPFHEEVKSRADELISDLITKLDPYDFQDLVAGVLRAMGFRAESSPPGPDQGVDIVAYPDALGFGKPRIKVQVKHRTKAVGGPELRNFLAALNPEDNGLFISTGGYTKDAEVEKARARSPLTLLDRDGFIGLLIENYEKLDPEFQAKVPLKKIWVPSSDSA